MARLQWIVRLGAVGLAATGCAIAATLPPRLVANAPVLCPERLTTEQRSAAPTGWQAERTGSDGPLKAFAFYVGPVAERVELAPDEERTVGQWTESIWTLGDSPRPVRLACVYGATDIVLTRGLPTGLKQCSVRIRRDTGLVTPTSLRCK